MPTIAIRTAVALLVWTSTTLIQAAPPVQLELVTEAGFPLGGERRWLETLGQLPAVEVRIRTARADDEPAVRERGGGFHVLGVLTARNVLRLPGGTFPLQDRRGLVTWLERLRADGAEGLTAPRGAFGLTEKQLAAIHDGLQPSVSTATRDLALEELLDRIRQRTSVPIEVAPGLHAELARAKVLDEFSALSVGTALAAALRPHGLVVALERRQSQTILLVARGQDAQEFWPVGYEADGTPNGNLPALFKSLNVEINETPLSEALDAIAARVAAPLLYDHNALAREGIDPALVRVSLPAERANYKRILDRLLRQAKLRLEVRTDEAGTPFLWITTVRRAS